MPAIAVGRTVAQCDDDGRGRLPLNESVSGVSQALGLRGHAALCVLERRRGSEWTVRRARDPCRDFGTRSWKPLGITGAALAAVRLQLASLPGGVSWTALHGCAWLGGISFTRSLFIATLGV
ncbi:MAG: hypothetical protein DMF94_21245 [Acidobacteria bacterium]|nr:MAG: hypothetical protein DMF94_21245 [Acidobacteriota bacterium]